MADSVDNSALDARVKAVEGKVEDHDIVIGELTAHLDEISTDFKSVVANIDTLATHFAQFVGWFQAKPTKLLLLLVLGLFLGPEGVQQVKTIFGL